MTDNRATSENAVSRRRSMTKASVATAARGGFEVELSWDNGHLTQAVIHSKSGLPCRVVYGEKHWEFDTEAGKSYPLSLAQ